MEIEGLSKVEQSFFNRSGRKDFSTKIPYIIVKNFPDLGLISSLRFLEWLAENPEGKISLPTGKTPEYFIKWTQRLLEGWNKPENRKLMEENGLFLTRKPSLKGLHFVQIDEFYPINPKHHNSFYDYVMNYYIKGFDLDPGRALLINADEIPLSRGKHFSEVFPDNRIDLTLRNREAVTPLEKLQQASLFSIDNWCTGYENRIREMGGIGFFLGGMGPDGHIAFNTRGSDHNSSTRLTATNFETQAASAGDLGGIEVSRTRLVITIGLGTITCNPDGVTIIFAAGEAKAPVVRNALENPPDNLYPATVLQRQKNARFYLTEGAAVLLNDCIEKYFKEGEWTFEKTEKAIFDLCQRIDKYAHKLEIDDLRNDRYCCLIPGLSMERVKEVIEATKKKIEAGNKKEQNQTFLHTGPHHDDIMLGIFPCIIPQLRITSNKFHFAVFTSGFTAVTNIMLQNLLEETLNHIEQDKINMIEYPDFFDQGYKYKFDKDVSHYLDKIAAKDEAGKLRGICHRMIRVMVHIYRLKSREELTDRIKKNIELLKSSYSGEKNSPDIQKLKGMLREYEEELVWAHYGVKVQDIEHLRLGFYTGDIFTPQPQSERDVEPILDMLRRVKPTIVSLAFDPEGSGPDTHYKVLQALAEALRQWKKETDTSALRIIGYRNVWFRFHPADANIFTPVSLNSMAILDRSFMNCYISQVDASFPSYELDGPFSDLSQQIWVEQFKRVQLILGKDFFYQHESPKIRATHGMIFHKEMKVDEFLIHARELEKSMEGETG
ncbi:MAG: glucosamine-6-phosphate isomerase [Bacteroidetes bacterium RBG_13_43_22]|nr:MAG: glucosamine-6-phosphate isomerase [Bacteroidetes bacterium RBG_13_43_22]